MKGWDICIQQLFGFAEIFRLHDHTALVHEPWKSNIKTDYPAPTVDHQLQRQRAIALFRINE